MAFVWFSFILQNLREKSVEHEFDQEEKPHLRAEKFDDGPEQAGIGFFPLQLPCFLQFIS